LPASRLGGTSAPATASGLVRPSAAARGCGLDSSDLLLLLLLLLSLKPKGLTLASQLGWSALLELLLERRIVVSTPTLSSLLMVVVLESANTTRVNSSVLLVLLLLLHGGVGIGHASLGVSVMTHSVGLSTVSSVLLGVVLVLILVVAVVISATVIIASTTALVLVTTGCCVVRVALVALVVVVRGTVALALSHHLRVSESTLDGTSELLYLPGVSIVVADSLLLVSTHSIKLMLGGSSLLGSVVEGGVRVGDVAWHAGRNTGCRCSSGDGGVVGS